MIDFKIEGLDELDMFNDLDKKLDRITREELHKVGEGWKEDCVNNTPVRDDDNGGTLSQSWELKKPSFDGNSYNISLENKTEYAKHVEFGHRIIDRNGKTHGSVKGVYMLRDSRRNARAVFPKTIKKIGKRLERELNND